MNIRDAKTLARAKMKEHGLIGKGWQLKFDQAKTRTGQCSYRDKTISLSEPVTLLNPKSEVLDTILHEIAHALTPGAYHGDAWKAVAMSIGASGNRCAAASTVTPPEKWIAYCPNGHTYAVHKRALRIPRSCGGCSGTFNPKYIIKYRLNERTT